VTEQEREMKILFITAQLPHGADEAFLIPEVDQMRSAGHEVLVIPRSPRGRIIHGQLLLKDARREGLYSPRVWKAAAAVAITKPGRTVGGARSLLGSRSATVALKNFAVFPKALWLADLATRWNADHIHCHWAGTTATMAMLASTISGVPWSFTAHRWDIVENNLLAAKARSASLARFICEDGLRMAQAAGVALDHHVQVLHLGVAVPPHARRSTGSAPVVLCPARLLEVKGHRFLLEAWRILKDRQVEGELWLAGQGELRTDLEALTRTLGLAASVDFLGAVPHPQLMNMYQEAQVSAVVLASVDLGNGFHEGIPAALIEAMSYGLPVAATTTGGVPELVRPGTGLLVPPGDPVALADALQTLLQSGTLREQLGDAGRQRVIQAYDAAGITSALLSAMEAARTGGTRAAPQYVSQAI
jgi:colanic acid/amylovoran biosynthesis glycosyltransferase